MIKTVSLANIANIRFGLHSQPVNKGKVAYLQVRHFNDGGKLVNGIDEHLPLDTKIASHFLLEDDILFVGKGTRLFAWCYKDNGQPTVASSIFFVLRPDTKLIYPEYLTAILNAPQCKAAFLQLGAGTSIFSIRKSELGAYHIPLPSLPQQRKISMLSALHEREIDVAQQMISQKQQLYTAVISKLIKS